MKKRVLLYTDTYLKYSETFIYNQLRGISEHFEVLVISNKMENLNFQDLKHVVFKHVPFNFQQNIQRNFINPYKLHKSYEWKLEEVVKAFKPDMIHAHFGHNGLKIVPLAKKLKIPLLVTFWGSDASKRLRDKRYVKQLKKHFCYAKSLCCSNELKSNLARSGFDVSKVHVHYAGVNVERFPLVRRKSLGQKSANGERIVFLQVSRFVKKKGHHVTVRAFRAFLDRVPNPDLYELRLIGDGPLMQEIKELVDELGLNSYVHFLGIKKPEEVIQEMISADVLLQHSVVANDGDMEGLPIVIMEGMATGLVVMSTYHSGIPELIENGVNGFLVPEMDTTAYVKQLEALLSIPDTQMAELARKTIEKDFNLSVQNGKLAEMYREILTEA